MKNVIPFKQWTKPKKFEMLLWDEPQEKPEIHLFPEDLQDLWSCTLAKESYLYIGYLKVNYTFFPFCLDSTDKNLPVLSIDADWSEQECCLIHTHVKQFYGFLRLLKQYENQLQLKLPEITKNLEFPEFWNKLV